MKPTKEEIAGTIQLVKCVADTIRELKQVPSGHLYAQMMAHVNLPTYNGVITVLKASGLVREENHLLIWVEPKPPLKLSGNMINGSTCDLSGHANKDY